MKDFFLGLLKFLVILVILGIIGLFLMYKCTKSVSEGINEMHNPKNYAVSIKDFVRYTLAEAHPEFANYGYYDSELKIKTSSKISQLANKEDDPEKASYKIALETLSKNGTDFEKRYAGNLLKTYNALKIDLTPYKVDEEHDFKWHFTEKNSRVRFTVSLGLLSYYDADSWDLERYTEYLETGIFSSAPDAPKSIEKNDDIKNSGLNDDEKHEKQETCPEFKYELDEAQCAFLANRLEKIGILGECHEKNRQYFTDDYLATWDEFYAMPDIEEYAGYLGYEGWMFIGFQDDCNDFTVHIVSLQQNHKDSTATVSFYYTCYGWQNEEELHSLYITWKNSSWLIDEYDDSKQMTKEHINSAIMNFNNKSYLSVFENAETPCCGEPRPDEYKIAMQEFLSKRKNH